MSHDPISKARASLHKSLQMTVVYLKGKDTESEVA